MDKSTWYVVVIPNLNGGDELLTTVESLVNQTVKPYIIIVDNASSDDSIEKLLTKYPDIEIIRNSKNKGYVGGVNPGLKRAIELGAKYTGPFNDDAIGDKNWLKSLVNCLEKNPKAGAAAPKVLGSDKKHIDSTGEFFSIWGLPYPRGRGEKNIDKYDQKTEIFAASGAASLYRVEALKEVGLFDEDFFAYYEDVDLGFRMQLAGWRAAFVPSAVVYHRVGMTSQRMRGFTTKQTLKNLPLLWFKNVPSPYLWRVGWRLALAQVMFFARAVSRGNGWSAIKGMILALILVLKKIPERQIIQRNKKVPSGYIWGLLIHDLPPNARSLRKFRLYWWKVVRRQM